MVVAVAHPVERIVGSILGSMVTDGMTFAALETPADAGWAGIEARIHESEFQLGIPRLGLT